MSSLIQVFFSPVEAYRNIGTRSILLPAIILILLVIGIMTYLQSPVLARDQVQMIKNNPELAARVPTEHLQAMTEMTFVRKIITSVTQSLTILIGLVVYSLILLVMSRVSGCDMTYRTALSIVLLSAMIHPVLATVVKTPLILSRGTALGVSMSPALLLPDLDPISLTFQILERFDIFLLWSLVVLVTGITVVSGVSRNRAAVIGILLWLVSGLLVILMFTVSMSLSGMS